MIQIVLIVLAVAVGLALETDHENQCGGLLREESGVIAPRISEGEEVFVCLWIIKNLPGKRIKLQVRDLYTVSDAYCSQDRIEIEDDDRVLGTFCREAEIPPMFTQNDHMYILSFHGNGPTLFFNASYSHIDVPKKQCGGVLQDEVGWLSSPDHDKDSLYDSSLDCTWIINAKSDRRILLHFLFFDVVGENNCQDGDYVKILKRGKETLGMFCDSKLPPIMVSDSTRLVLQFHTDYRNHAEGFNVTFTQVFVDSLNCGGLLNEDNGRLMISDIQNSSGNQECLWIISAREDKVVELTVTKLQIEQLTDCSEEHLRVYDDVRLSKKYCNSVVSTRVRSTTNMMFVVLKSNDPGRVTFRASFSQQYEFSDICGGIVNQSTGMITSPDENILTSLDSTIVDCFWVIEGEADTEIEFDIKNLQVYSTYPCKDYLQVYDGHSPKEKKCDSAIAKTPIRSVSNVLYVRFHTGTGGSFGKFRGRFSQKGGDGNICTSVSRV